MALGAELPCYMSFFELLQLTKHLKVEVKLQGGGGVKDPLLEELAQGDVMGFGVRSEYFFSTLGQG